MISVDCRMTETVTRASQCLIPKQAQTPFGSVNMYILDKAFQRLLQPFGLNSEPVPFQTIVQYLKEYIVSRGLFDPSRPNVIKCEGDALGSLFRRISFTNFEAVDLIRRHISPVFTQKLQDVEAVLNGTGLKSDVRVLEGVADDEEFDDFSSGSDSAGSSRDIEEIEIAFSDSSSGGDSSIFEEFQNKASSRNLNSADLLSDKFESDGSVTSCFTEFNEFEPFSELESDDGADMESYSSASDLEIHIVEKEITLEVQSFNEDDGWFADSSDAGICFDSSEPVSLSPWFCKCSNEIKNSRNGFCHSCWSAQFGWQKEEDRRIPPRMLKRKRRSQGDQRKTGNEYGTVKRLKGVNEDNCDTGEIFPASQTSGSSDLGPEEGGTQEVFGACVICESRPRNTAIVHGRSAHIVACYKCSRKIQEKKLKCPQCRRCVERVVRLYL